MNLEVLYKIQKNYWDYENSRRIMLTFTRRDYFENQSNLKDIREDWWFHDEKNKKGYIIYKNGKTR
jgi:hypothetical protein